MSLFLYIIFEKYMYNMVTLLYVYVCIIKLAN